MHPLPGELPFLDVTKERSTSRRPSPFTSDSSSGDRSPPDVHIKEQKGLKYMPITKRGQIHHTASTNEDQAGFWFPGKWQRHTFPYLLGAVSHLKALEIIYKKNIARQMDYKADEFPGFSGGLHISQMRC